MNTNFEHYRIFYYVAKYGNLTKAATVLHTSQPSVTRTIHNLEKNLNCRLFERSKVGMKLTPEGEVFYEYIAAGCAQFFKAESNLSDMLSLENGTIYVSATETALHCYLFQAMESFNEQYPNVHFKILNNSTRKSINIVKEGNVDFAVVSAPFQIEKPLQQKVLRKYHDILIGGKRFEELKGQKISIKQLAQYPWISLTPEAITRKFLNQYFEKNGLKFEADMELATTDMILPAVRHNLGIGFIPPEFAKDDLESGEYQQKIYRINSDNGNVLGTWGELGYIRDMDREDVKYFRRVCEPKMLIDNINVVRHQIEINFTMEPNEITFVRIRKIG